MLESLLGTWGDGAISALGGLLLGATFGMAAQRSRFCLRAATIDFWRGAVTAKVAVWVLAFSAAVTLTQLAILMGWLDPSGIRALSAQGSMSGAIIGGALFGAGMVLTRGCASRLLVLSANGNLRALLSGLVFAVTAQASLRGILSPIRDWLATLWTISDPTQLNGLAGLGLAQPAGLVFGLLWCALGFAFARRERIGLSTGLAAVGVGLVVGLAWIFTSQVAGASFDPQPVKSLSFTGPSANVLMLVLSQGGQRLDFDIGLVPGVVLGSFLAAAYAGELKLEGFHDGLGMRRYLAGAFLMGFGGMLAGGCAIGAGVSGAAVFAVTAWVTLVAMWAAAGLTDGLLDRPATAAAQAATN